jgi:hypothetical protein
MFYVIPMDAEEFTVGEFHPSFTSFLAAREYAENLKKETGENYVIHQISSVYTTQTLDEALKGEAGA